jgi:dTMP kinase
MSVRGYFIVFEGCDGSGKSTQVRRLCESGLFPSHHQMAFPDRTTAIGQVINQYLRNTTELNDQAIHLLFSANRWELSAQIKSLLENGTTIVCDRYWFSGTAYSAAKGLNFEWCKSPEVGLPEPDLVIFLDVDPEELLNRKGFGSERYEKLELQRKVRDAFKQLKGPKWIEIDGSKPQEEVWQAIETAVTNLVPLQTTSNG